MKGNKIFIWILRVVPALIMLQTLWFKFTASAESVYIFSTLGIEPWGRIAAGVSELFAGILLLIPRYSWLGALLGSGIMAGALASHLFVLGVEVQGDGGQLFIYALVTLLCCFILLWMNKEKLFRYLYRK